MNPSVLDRILNSLEEGLRVDQSLQKNIQAQQILIERLLTRVAHLENICAIQEEQLTRLSNALSIANADAQTVIAWIANQESEKEN